jgi:hypothetical protein
MPGLSPSLFPKVLLWRKLRTTYVESRYAVVIDTYLVTTRRQVPGTLTSKA